MKRKKNVVRYCQSKIKYIMSTVNNVNLFLPKLTLYYKHQGSVLFLSFFEAAHKGRSIWQAKCTGTP